MGALEKGLTSSEKTIFQRLSVRNLADTDKKYFIPDDVIRQYSLYLRSVDPYKHPIALHTWPTEEIKKPSYEFVIANGKNTAIEGFSLQGHTAIVSYYDDTKRWREKSAAAGVPKVVTSDEQGPYESGIPPDANDKDHNSNRTQVLWPHYIAGGAGHLVYNGFFVDHSDISAEDFRPRQNWLDQVANVLKFFGSNNIPFQDMIPDNTKASDGAKVLYKKGSTYVVYITTKASTVVRFGSDSTAYKIKWYNPKSGGAMATGTVACVSGGGNLNIGRAAKNTQTDSVALLTKTKGC